MGGPGLEIVHLPLGRLSDAAERSAMRSGVLRPVSRPPLRLVDSTGGASRYCAACAAPVDFGAVWRGEQAFCSVECSLGGDLPA